MTERVNSRQAPIKVLKELFLGIGVSSVIFMAVGAIFLRPVWLYILFVLLGAIGAAVSAYNMYDTLDRALDLNRDDAKKFSTVRSILRIVVCMIILIVSINIDVVAFVGAVLGYFSLKISAFLNPFIKRVLYGKTDKDMIEGVDDTLDIEQK